MRTVMIGLTDAQLDAAIDSRKEMYQRWLEGEGDIIDGMHWIDIHRQLRDLLRAKGVDR